MKKFYVLLFSFCISFSLNAQLADGSIAPDFTTVDINGNTHNLYDYLNDGKVVIIDLFATWCPPCWNYHQSHALADAYDLYGPNGTDQMMIFGIEGDNSTNTECLYNLPGCNDTTLGDWVEGVPYPITEDTSIPGLYSLTYWPTIYIIYPDRKVYEIGQAPVSSITSRLDDIPELSAGINPNLLEFRGLNGGVCLTPNLDAPYYLINNMGETEITSMDIRVSKNNEILYEDSWTGSVQSYGLITEIQIPAQIIETNTEFICELNNINGDTSDSRTFNSYVTTETNNVVRVTVEADANVGSDNNRYEITDPSGQIVISQELEADSGEKTYSHNLLTTGCHTIWVYDDAGNGLSSKMEVRDGDGAVIYINDGFTNLDIQSFNVASISSIDEITSVSNMRLMPNPVNQILSISINLTKKADFKYTVTNLAGKQIISNNFYGLIIGQNQKELNVSDLTNGLYFLTISNEEGTLTQKFIKN